MLKHIKKYFVTRNDNKQFNELISDIDQCCFWKANSKEPLISWIKSMKLFGYTDESISVAMVLVKGD